ncbi:MAG: long-chain fatty acid--CoA ligase [Pseudobdellovibrionaceae bacterium]|nr:long-chain fatty acid--CoA ligase [Pseudobdellovibrionaceae bacterium]
MQQNKDVDVHFWAKAYPEKIDWNIHGYAALSTGPIFQYLESTRKKFPHRLAFRFMGKSWTWEEIGSLVDRMAKGLHDHGVERGVKVGLCLPNCPYFLIAYYAIAKTGATIVNYNPLYAEEEIANQIEDSQTDYMVTVDLALIYGKLEKMLHRTRLNQIIVCPFSSCLPFPKNILFSLFKKADVAKIPNDDRHIYFKQLVSNDGQFLPPPINTDSDVALLQYTGGTTGTPKGAMLTHANLTANVEQCLRWFYDVHQGQERMLAVIPFFHVFAMTTVLNLSVKCGFEIIASPRFNLEETLELIHREKPHFFPAVPAIYNAINAHPHLKSYDLTSLRYCISGGAPLPVEVKKAFEAETGCVLVEGYGLTETSPVACANPIEGMNKSGSIGLPLPGTIIELHDTDTGETVTETGKRGELWIKGPQVMKGYWNKPDETEKVLENGFLKTGDVATYDDDGYIFIVDRIKDLILVNGYNVYPRMIEEAIYQHPSVEECVVAGITDATRGEVPKAWIKLREGRKLSEEDLRLFLEEKISRIEMPRHIEFRSEPLPKTMIGKLSKKDLLAQEIEKTQAVSDL